MLSSKNLEFNLKLLKSKNLVWSLNAILREFGIYFEVEKKMKIYFIYAK